MFSEHVRGKVYAIDLHQEFDLRDLPFSANAASVTASLKDFYARIQYAPELHVIRAASFICGWRSTVPSVRCSCRGS